MAKLIMLVGLPASGKSTWAMNYKKIMKEEVVVLSSDVIRGELWGDENDQREPYKVFEVLHKEVRLALSQDISVIYDATNLSAKKRQAFLNSISHIKCEKIVCVFATPFQECMLRDKARSRTVGREVIVKMMKLFQMPHKYEGWEEIRIIQDNNCFRNNLVDMLALEVAHDCAPHHLEKISDHMKMCSQKARSAGESYEVCIALLFHDVGKFYTKSFINAKGEPSEVAHYYSHENVSSYLFLTSKEWDSYKNSRYILYLIQYHMRPYFQGYDKFSKGFSINFIRDLEAVHRFDRLGRKTI